MWYTEFNIETFTSLQVHVMHVYDVSYIKLNAINILNTRIAP